MLGALQVGVIDSLARRGLVPDLLVGTSVGAINASYWAFNPGPDAGRKLLAAWLDMDRHRVFPRNPFPAIQGLLRGRDHLLDNGGLVQLLERNLGPEVELQASSIPIQVVATDVHTGERVIMREGNALRAVLASSAIPGVFVPISVDGRVLIDGGVVSNVELEGAVESGATDIIAVDLTGPVASRASSNVLDVMQRTITLSLRRQTDLMLRAVRKQAHVAVLRPSFGWRAGLGTTQETLILFALGRSCGEDLVERFVRGRTVAPGMFEPHLEPPPEISRRAARAGPLGMLRSGRVAVAP
jgi:NTE family protein